MITLGEVGDIMEDNLIMPEEVIDFANELISSDESEIKDETSAFDTTNLCGDGDEFQDYDAEDDDFAESHTSKKCKGKKIIAILLVLAVVIPCLVMAISGLLRNGRVSGGVKWSLSDGTLTVSGKGSMGEWRVSQRIKDKIETVYIGAGVTSVSPWAFSECKNLKSIYMSDSVKTIDHDAFSYCTSLTRVTMSDKLTNIGNGAFSSCTALKEITIPDSVTSMGNGVFYKCDSLEDVTLPNGITEIRPDMFNGCISLANIAIPYSVKGIGERAFGDCDSLVNMVVPNGVTNIDDDTFYDCDNLTRITIPESVTYINCIFDNCTSLKDIIYTGTKNQWIQLEKNMFWKLILWSFESETGEAVFLDAVVHCKDGDIEL